MTAHEGFLDDETVLATAADAGFVLVQYETDVGQPVWEWRRGDAPGPQFVTRRIAIRWMAGSSSGSYGIVEPSESRPAPGERSEDARIFMSDVNITPSEGGPYLVSGAVHLTDVDGREIRHPDLMALCRCGHSTNKPFCDGTHASIAFDGTLKN